MSVSTGEMRFMWSTPLFSVNLNNKTQTQAAGGGYLDVKKLNRGLNKAVLTEYEGFIKNIPDASKSGSSNKANNELFFAWQRDSWNSLGKTALDNYPEFVQMKQIMQVKCWRCEVGDG